MKLLSTVKTFFGGKLKAEEPPPEEPEVTDKPLVQSKVIQTSRNTEGAYQPRFYRRR